MANATHQTVQTVPTALESIDQFVSWVVENAQVKGPKIVDWLYTEVPEVVEQFLAWHFAASLIAFLLCAFFILAFPYIAFVAVKRIILLVDASNIKHINDKTAIKIVSSVVLGIMVMVAQVIAWNNIQLTWLQIWLAPKVYLLETFTKTIN